MLLGEPKRTFWITALLTGARQGSIRMMLRWEDVDLDRKVIRFLHAKRESYAVPTSDLLAAVLRRYRDRRVVTPSAWIFPSPRKNGRAAGRVKERKSTIRGPQALCRTFKTMGVGIVSPEESRLLMGHGSSDDVNCDYITLALVVEPLRPAVNRIAERYREILPQLWR